MSVELLVAPPASGKTHVCIRQLREVLQLHPLAYARVVLPDRTQVRFFRSRLARAGGALGVHTGTFWGLYNEILSRAGIDFPMAHEPLQHSLIRSAVEQLFNDGKLSYYAALRQMTGFTQMLCERIAELKRSLVAPDDFLQLAVDTGECGLIELAMIYQQYQHRLNELEWNDMEGMGWLAVDALEQDHSLMSDMLLLVVDGFDSFNRTQQRALKLLGERLPQVLITLPGTPTNDRSAQRRFAHTRASLEAAMSLDTHTLPCATRLPPTLAHLERSLFEVGVQQAKCEGDLNMLEVRSPEHEAREALRWLKARHQRHKMSLSDGAVIVPDMGIYRPLLHVAAIEFGLPLRFAFGERISGTPLIAALMDLLQLSVRNYPLRPLLDVMRSPFFDLSNLGLKHQHARIFELVSRYAQVIEGIDQWEEAFHELSLMEEDMDAEVSRSEDDQDEDGTIPRLPRGKDVEVPRSGLHTLAGRLKPPQDRQTMEGWVRWLEDLLGEVRIFELADSADEKAALLELRQVLRALVLSKMIAGERPMDYTAFLTALQGGLETTTYQLQDDASLPAIYILTMPEARGLRFSAVAVLGLSEGSFPNIERPDPILSEEVRAHLGMEGYQGREQGGLFYQLLTRADTCLLLTRPYLAEDGEIWEPSPYWTAVKALLLDQTQRRRPDDPRPLADAASSGELLFWAVRRAVASGHGLPSGYDRRLLSRWEQLRHSRDVLSARRTAEPIGPYEGYVEGIATSLSAHFDTNYEWSASQLESYALCPFKFFTERVLRLEPIEIPKPGFDIAQAGSIVHAVLEHAYCQAANPSDPSSVLEALYPAAKEVFSAAPQRYGFRPSILWEVQQGEILDSMKENILALADFGPEWMPMEFERRYGIQEAPMLELKIAGQNVRLHGVIDRIDRRRDGKLRVMDYKSGGYIGKNDLVEGRRLQLPLYALAAMRALTLGEVAEGYYWILSTRKPSSLKLSNFKFEDLSGVEAGIEALRCHIARVIHGARAGEFPPIPPKGGCPSYCPVAAWCWRYERAAW